MHRLHRIQAMKAVRLRAVTKVGALIPVFFLLSFLAGCGGSKPPGPSLFPGKITLTPATIATVQLGSTVIFSASAQNASGTSVNATFTYQSSDTSILNIAPNGVACAGIWDAAFVNCTPGNYGVVQVTASAFGATSPPTLVYVHPPIDNIQISFVKPITQPPPACPGQQTIPLACIPMSSVATQSCLSANQTMTLQANAFSKDLDITAAVGPFTWTETSPSVVGVAPLVTNTTTNIPTNQVAVSPNAPGFTAVYAAASNVSSQPYYAETCPVQCVALELGGIGSGQTSFSVNKSTSETVIATAVDVQGCVVPKPQLTWSSSQPGSVLAGSAAAGCGAGTTCALSTPSPGAGSVTAACIPPSCNIGFPQSVVGLPQTLFQPVPVYPVNAISGLVSGAPVSTSVLVTSLDCATNLYCSDNLYSVSTSTKESGNPTAFPEINPAQFAPPNSLILDPAGDKAYMGGNFESLAINPANFGSSNSPFSSLGNVTGKVLATSANGNSAIFSDTTHTPNQVYVVNTAASSASGITTLYISGATAAAFSPDGLKAFIVGPAGPSCNIASAPACLYVYSPVQALQTIPLTAVATAITFSSTGAFAFLTGGSATSAITAFNTCDNSSIPLAITLPAAPLFLKDVPPGSAPPPVASAGFISACDPKAIHSPTNCAGLDVLIGLDNTGMDLIATNNYQPSNAPACPQTVAAASNPPFSPQHFDLGQGTFNPINFFLSPDASTAYIVASDRSEILVYNFLTHSTAGIPLANNITTGQSVTPVTASITVDGTLIYVAGSDGNLHEVSTTAGTDLMQITFPNLPDVTNPFCSNGASTIACTLDFVAVKP